MVVTTPTIGSNVEEVVYKNIRFLMWDIGGQGKIICTVILFLFTFQNNISESLRASWHTYYVNTHVSSFLAR